MILLIFFCHAVRREIWKLTFTDYLYSITANVICRISGGGEITSVGTFVLINFYEFHSIAIFPATKNDRIVLNRQREKEHM